MKLHSLICTLRIKISAGLIPGDIADGISAQVRQALQILEYLTDKSELTFSDGQDAIKQCIKTVALIIRLDIFSLSPGNQP